MFNTKKCIVCSKKQDKNIMIKQDHNYFCSEKCKLEYKKLLIQAKKTINLDDCC